MRVRLPPRALIKTDTGEGSTPSTRIMKLLIDIAGGLIVAFVGAWQAVKKIMRDNKKGD